MKMSRDRLYQIGAMVIRITLWYMIGYMMGCAA